MKLRDGRLWSKKMNRTMVPRCSDHIGTMAFSGGSFYMHIGFRLAVVCGVYKISRELSWAGGVALAYRSNVIQRGHNHTFWAFAAIVKVSPGSVYVTCSCVLEGAGVWCEGHASFKL